MEQEARPFDVSLGEATKPSLSGRIYYALGGTLGERELEWVRQDLTSDGWRKRQTLRLGYLFDVFAVIFAVLPGRLDIRLSIAGMLVLAGALMGAATSTRFRNRRLENHGFKAVPPPSNKEDEYLDALEAQESAQAEDTTP